MDDQYALQHASDRSGQDGHVVDICPREQRRVEEAFKGDRIAVVDDDVCNEPWKIRKRKVHPAKPREGARAAG